MSPLLGTKRTWRSHSTMSAFGGKADIVGFLKILQKFREAENRNLKFDKEHLLERLTGSSNSSSTSSTNKSDPTPSAKSSMRREYGSELGRVLINRPSVSAFAQTRH
jgi:hypothetical protein